MQGLVVLDKHALAHKIVNYVRNLSLRVMVPNGIPLAIKITSKIVVSRSAWS